MKQVILSVILFISSILSGIGQNSAFDEVFEKYASQPGFEMVSISGELLEMAASMEHELEDLQIGNIKILSVEDHTLNQNLNFYQEILAKLELSDYTRLLNIEDESNQLIILKKKKSRGEPEFMLITGGDDNTMIYIEGDLDLRELSKVSKALESGDLSAHSINY